MALWKAEISHDGLKKYRVITGRDKDVVNQKANTQLALWADMWQRRLDLERKSAERIQRSFAKESLLSEANELTKRAVAAIDDLHNILKKTLDKDDRIAWNLLIDSSVFSQSKPVSPIEEAVPFPPNKESLKYKPQLGLFDRLFLSRRESRIKDAELRYQSDVEEWRKNKKEIEEKNSKAVHNYSEELTQWEEQKRLFNEKQTGNNQAIEKLKAEYLSGEPEAISEYCDLVLSASDYPAYFPQEFAIEYNPASKMLIVEYVLPSIDELPHIKEVKYIRARGEFKESCLPESTINKLYDDLIYQIALRTVHELLEADSINALEGIVFNGWVNSVDKATGQSIKPCIISLQVSRTEFTSIDLAKIDPKTCFKSLKGVGSSKLHSLTPIAPILNISKDDKRFVPSYNVADVLNDSVNLAAMDWEDFEHLIRELFEKEFSVVGGEVKITRASRDSGVDAVAFDPDPIRGGKIVIQAKRYTNTVGVSAVRDLFGTVMNEGATKGILVTTTDYGPDAYDFAKGKPLTLLSGSNLLHLLEKHGHKAMIDIKAAKKVLAEKGA